MSFDLMVTVVFALQDAAQVTGEAQNVFKTVLSIVTTWVFPICAIYCFLYGILAKGVKRGEWDMAAICVLAAVALALFPQLLKAIFNVTF